MPVSVKVGGAWKTATNVYNKVGGVWKTATDMPVKVGGVWKTGVLIQTDYESIATVNWTSGTSITFSSIPQTYKHLQIRGITKFSQTSSADYTVITLQFNGSSTTKSHEIYADSTVGSSSQTDWIGYMPNNNSALANMYGVFLMDIADYSSTSKNKTARAISGFATGNAATPNIERLAISSAFQNSTSAITSITLANGSGTAWTSGTSFALYGIKG